MGMLPAAVAIARHHAARADEDDRSRAAARAEPRPYDPEIEARLDEIRNEYAVRRLDRQLRHMRVMTFLLLAFLAAIAYCVLRRLA